MTKILGTPGTFVCPLCQQSLPSQHALAAHTHRRHSVVNRLTLFTDGTTCLWCHTNHHSTDRLTYHLRTTPNCLHGLRVTVGHAYTYGSGTKRSGARGHRGLPPTRLPGPLNATPAQRAAAAEGRAADEQELQRELQAAAGVSNVFSWPELSQEPGRLAPELARTLGNMHSGLPSSAIEETPTGELLSFWRIADAFSPNVSSLPSPYWPGLSRQQVCWGLPPEWHRWWNLWLAADSVPNPWSAHARRAQKPLRPRPTESIAQHCAALRRLAANTVAFRQICTQVTRSGMLWIPGVPSSAGRILLRRVLPRAIFSTVQPAGQPIFVAAASEAIARVGCAALFSSASDGTRPCTGLALQPLPVYRTRSLDRA